VNICNLKILVVDKEQNVMLGLKINSSNQQLPVNL